MSGLNYYLLNLSTIRPYLRLLATGRIYIGELPRPIQDNKTRINHFLKEIKRRKKKVGKKDYESLSTDSYMNNNNYLVDIYRIKSFTKEKITSLLMLMQIINENSGDGTDGISQTEILDQITMILPDKAAIDNTIKRHISDLHSNRIICKKVKESVSKEKKRNGPRYYFSDNPLANLTDEEYHELVLAIGFYKNISLLSLFGYFLETKLMDMYNQVKLPMIPAQFHRRSMVNIIDEEIVYQLFCAWHEKRLVQVIYRKRSDNSQEFKEEIYPLKIQERFFHGNRQSLICIPFKNDKWSEHLLTIPLENINEVKILERFIKVLPNNLPKNEQFDMSFCVFYDTEENKENLITRIKNLSGKVTIEPEQKLNNEYYCIVNIKTTEPSSFIPFVQSNYPDIIVIAAPNEVMSRIKTNIKETLKYYE